MFRIVELEYPCFDTDLISPSSMTKGKKKLPCVSADVSMYLHSSCASRVSRCIGVTGLTISQIFQRLLNQNLRGKVKRGKHFFFFLKPDKGGGGGRGAMKSDFIKYPNLCCHENIWELIGEARSSVICPLSLCVFSLCGHTGWVWKKKSVCWCWWRCLLLMVEVQKCSCVTVKPLGFQRLFDFTIELVEWLLSPMESVYSSKKTRRILQNVHETFFSFFFQVPTVNFFCALQSYVYFPGQKGFAPPPPLDWLPCIVFCPVTFSP